MDSTILFFFLGNSGIGKDNPFQLAFRLYVVCFIFKISHLFVL
jgi:hypothetical protein